VTVGGSTSATPQTKGSQKKAIEVLESDLFEDKSTKTPIEMIKNTLPPQPKLAQVVLPF